MSDAGALPPGTRFVDAFVFDLNGIARGKRLPADDWPGACAAGVAFSASALVLDAQGNAQGPLGLGTEDGDPDAWGWPAPARTRPVTWASQPTAQALLSMRGGDGAALWFDPREILARVIARLHADGLYPVVACELEFYLVEADARGRPAPPAGAIGWFGRAPVRAADRGSQRLSAPAARGPGRARDRGGYNGVRIRAGSVRGQSAPHRRCVACGRRGRIAAPSRGRRGRLDRHAREFHGQALCRTSRQRPARACQPGGRARPHNRFGAPMVARQLLEHAVAGMQALHAQSMAIFAPSFSRVSPLSRRRLRQHRMEHGARTIAAWPFASHHVRCRRPAASNISVACADASPHLVLACILAGLASRHYERPARRWRQTDPPRDLVTALAALEGGRGKLAAYFPEQFAGIVLRVQAGGDGRLCWGRSVRSGVPFLPVGNDRLR